MFLGDAEFALKHYLSKQYPSQGLTHTHTKKSSTTGLVEGEEYQKIWNLFGV